MNKTPHPNILLKLENPSCLHSGTPKATTSAENRLQLPSLHHRPYRDSTSRVSATRELRPHPWTQALSGARPALLGYQVPPLFLPHLAARAHSHSLWVPSCSADP